MKPIRFISSGLIAAVMLLGACSDDEKNSYPEGQVKITVDEVTSSGARITYSLASGTVDEARTTLICPLDEFPGDPEDQNKLVAFAASGGKVRQLPYVETVTGLRMGIAYIAVIVGFAADGQALSTAYEIIYTGEPSGNLTDDGSAGELQESNW